MMSQDEYGELVVKYLNDMRNALVTRMQDGEEVEPSAYTAAVNMYLGELLWASDIPLDKAIPVVTGTLRASYKSCDSLETKGAGNATIQ